MHHDDGQYQYHMAASCIYNLPAIFSKLPNKIEPYNKKHPIFRKKNNVAEFIGNKLGE